jgi:hypothetical protein
MAMAPSNNPMMSGDGRSCLWGEEPIGTSSTSAPALHETPHHVRRDPSRDREREEGFLDHPRSSSTEKRVQLLRSETQPFSTTRAYYGDGPSMVSARTARKDTSDEADEVRKLFKRWDICRSLTQRLHYNHLRDRLIAAIRQKNG